MNDFLQVAVDAHGGLSRWNQLKRVKASLSITGAIWQLKGKPDALAEVSIEAELHKERLTTHFNDQGTRTVFEPNRVSGQTEGGRLVDSRDDPRSAFRGHTRQTPWDDLHVAYFRATRCGITSPFLSFIPTPVSKRKKLLLGEKTVSNGEV